MSTEPPSLPHIEVDTPPGVTVDKKPTAHPPRVPGVDPDFFVPQIPDPPSLPRGSSYAVVPVLSIPPPLPRTVLYAALADMSAILVFGGLCMHHDLSAPTAIALVLAVLSGRMRPAKLGGTIEPGGGTGRGGSGAPSGLLTILSLVWHGGTKLHGFIIR